MARVKSNGIDLGFGNTKFHLSLLWAVLLFCLVTVIVMDYAGRYRYLGKREFPDTKIYGNLEITSDLNVDGHTISGSILANGDTDINGNLTVTGNITSSDSIRARGQDTTKPSLLVKYAAPAASIGTGAVTLTIAQVLTGILEEDPEGSVTWTLPTAALAVAGVTDVALGDTFDFHVINNATAATNETITIAAGSGGTAVGNMVVATPDTTAGAENSGSAHFRIRFTNVTSSSEAYSVYRLS